MHTYRWDLDKTYLDTDIDSVSGLIRAAVESATSKRTVPGAGALMRALQRRKSPCRIVILSGSPEQMRPVIAEKLALDGVRVDSLVLKDNLGNLRKGRLRAVRGQVGYKLPQLLSLRASESEPGAETLFGDDSEADAAIYALYADVISGQVSATEMERILKAAGAYRDAISLARGALERLALCDAVDHIFIHLQPRVAPGTFGLLGNRVTPVFSWMQAAALLHLDGRLAPRSLESVALACSRDPQDWAAWLSDLVRRGLMPANSGARLFESAGALTAAAESFERRVDRLGGFTAAKPSREPDYLGFLHAVRAR